MKATKITNVKPCGKTFLDSHILKNHIHTYNSWIPHYFMIDISQNISRIKLFQMTRKTSQYFNMKLFYTFKALKPPSSLVVDFVGDEKRPWLTTSAMQGRRSIHILDRFQSLPNIKEDRDWISLFLLFSLLCMPADATSPCFALHIKWGNHVMHYIMWIHLAQL